MTENTTVPLFSKVLFWDTDFEKIDYDLQARDVIARVIMYGNWSDWTTAKAYYGLERIKDEMLQVRSLDKKSLHFLHFLFNTPKDQFRCYTWQQSNPAHWDF
ncbi:MAG: hypothetical protein ABIQ93_06850 [Saprospiraceae bacterium]